MEGRDWRTEESKELLRGFLRGLQAEVVAAVTRNVNRQAHEEWVQFSTVAAAVIRTEEEFVELSEYLTHCMNDPNADALLLMQLTMMGVARVTCAQCGHIHQNMSHADGTARCGHHVVTTDVQWKERTGKTTYQTTVCMCDEAQDD